MTFKVIQGYRKPRGSMEDISSYQCSVETMALSRTVS